MSTPCRPIAGLISRFLPWLQIVAVQRCVPPLHQPNPSPLHMLLHSLCPGHLCHPDHSIYKYVRRFTDKRSSPVAGILSTPTSRPSGMQVCATLLLQIEVFMQCILSWVSCTCTLNVACLISFRLNHCCTFDTRQAPQS